MSNMSYCMFENTVNDMQDCVDKLEEVNWDIEALINKASSKHEARAIKRFISICQDVADVTNEGDGE